MQDSNLLTLLPLIVLAAAIVILLLTLAFNRTHLVAAALTLGGLALAFVTLFVPAAAPQVTPLLVVDGYTRFFVGLLLAASFAVGVLSYNYLETRSGIPGEFYLLLLLATLGSAVLVASSHYASFFLGLELLSVSLYSLIAYLRPAARGIEAAIKYLILAAASSSFLLFGMALVYAQTGTMEFARLATAQPPNANAENLVILTGTGMIIVGFGFKLALVPFHLWTPDVYEGAPAPVTAFIASVSKGAMFALLLRYFVPGELQEFQPLFLAFAAIALASMIVGNLLALVQSNVKRILAYSSIAHIGYLLVAFLASGALAVNAVAFYLVSYFVTTLGAFGVVTVLSSGERDADCVDDYRGLFSRRPGLAVAFTAMLLSLAGIPLTSGFVGKVYLVAAGVGSALWLLVAVLVVTSAIGLYYYLRIVVAMYSPAPEAATPIGVSSLALGGSVALAALTLLLVWLGVYPAPLIELIQAVAKFG
ncbi:MAG: NADH-quinone oxidoreductase subunit N [Chloroflexi bacterium]|nr:NADH-quinone oxidoreductase subunit N [Chloroflexota bacterium]